MATIEILSCLSCSLCTPVSVVCTELGLPSPRNPSFSANVSTHCIAFSIQRYRGRRQGGRENKGVVTTGTRNNDGVGINHSAARTHARTHAHTPFKAPACAPPRQIQSLFLAALLSRYLLSLRSLMRMPLRSASAIHCAGCRVDRVSE